MKKLFDKKIIIFQLFLISIIKEFPEVESAKAHLLNL
jgi:hypothetical protein